MIAWSKTSMSIALPAKQSCSVCGFTSLPVPTFQIPLALILHWRVPPEEWSEPVLEQVCVAALPMMVAADDLYFTSMAPVLSAFFEFLAKRKLVKSASSLAQKVRGLEQQIVQNALDPEHWNAAKTIFMAGIKAGVDMMNERERNRFVESAREGPLGRALAERSLKEKESLRTRKKKGKREEKGDVMSIDSYCELVKIGE